MTFISEKERERQLEIDLIRFTDGRIDPLVLRNNLVERWIEDNVWDESFWLDRQLDVAKKYAPDLYKQWQSDLETEEKKIREKPAPLVWKSVVVPAGTRVRMQYGGKYHYAKISNGKICDGRNEFTPSEWASSVANYTSRNAWRDIWFHFPNKEGWISAHDLREKQENAK